MYGHFSYIDFYLRPNWEIAVMELLFQGWEHAVWDNREVMFPAYGGSEKPDFFVRKGVDVPSLDLSSCLLCLHVD